MIVAHIHVDCAAKTNSAAACMPMRLVPNEEEEEKVWKHYCGYFYKNSQQQKQQLQRRATADMNIGSTRTHSIILVQ